MTNERGKLIDDLVEQWHQSRLQQSLMDFLKGRGVSEDEWRLYFIGEFIGKIGRSITPPI